LGTGYTKTKDGNTFSSVTSYGFGPFARYYFLEKENQINLFVNANYAYNINKINNSGTKGTMTSYNYSFSGGPVVYFNSSVGLEFTIGWYHYKSIDDKSFTNSIRLGLGFQIHLEK